MGKGLSQTGGLTDTLKGNPPHLSPPASARNFGKDGDSSAPSVHATGQAGADQQATLRNLFPRAVQIWKRQRKLARGSRSIRTYQNNRQGCHASLGA